jgi:hypothetical protein
VLHKDVETAPSPSDRLLEVIRLREEVDLVAETMMSPHRVFEHVSLQTPRLEPAELGFLRSVAYLFVLYYEVGDVAVPYLLGLWDAFGLDSDRQIRAHRELVRSLRTFLQHNLDPTSSTDRQTREVCQRWFAEQCHTPIPSSEDHWAACLHAILAEAASFLRTMNDCLRAIEVDEGRDNILDHWRFRISRHHPPEEFDRIIEEAAADLGRSHIDAVRLRRRYYDQWMDSLSYLLPDYDFHVEARRLAEHAMLIDIAAGMPITGQDIIAEFGLTPGPKVGSLLARARLLFEESPTDRDGLLAALRSESESKSPPEKQPPAAAEQADTPPGGGEVVDAQAKEDVVEATNPIITRATGN